MLIRNPLQLRYPIVDLDDSNMKASIDAFLKLLISSNKYDSIADEEFGFCLEDFRYVAPAEGDSLGRIRALESTTDSLYVVSDYKWESFGMKFDRYIIKGVDKQTAIKTFSQ